MPGMNYPALATQPPAGANSPDLYGTENNTDVNSVIELSFGKPFIKLGMVRMKVQVPAGSAANFTPRLFSKAGVTTAGDISQEYEGAATAVADLFDPQLGDAPVVMQADENGKLYFLPGPDAGNDNQVLYAFRFLIYG